MCRYTTLFHSSNFYLLENWKRCEIKPEIAFYCKEGSGSLHRHTLPVSSSTNLLFQPQRSSFLKLSTLAVNTFHLHGGIPHDVLKNSRM